jgi:hypothetical protein
VLVRLLSWAAIPVRCITVGRFIFVFAALLATACGSGGVSQSAGPIERLPHAKHAPGGKTPGHIANPGALPTSGVGRHPIKAHQGHVTVVISRDSAHICSLITRAQVDEVMGRALPAPRRVPMGTMYGCAIFQSRAPSVGGAPIRVGWVIAPTADSALLFHERTVNLPASAAVSGLRAKAYCAASSRTVQLFTLSGKWFLEVFADSCAHAKTLARIALGHL